MLGTGYSDHAAAVTSTAAELHRAGNGHPLAFQTEIPYRLTGGYAQRADLVMRAPEAKVPILLLEIDRRTEDAHQLVHKLRRYARHGRRRGFRRTWRLPLPIPFPALRAARPASPTGLRPGTLCAA
ncbi:replication-relaxation family protein, partial [Streptomyces yaizuensis]|uniref:replication-relaxation family protein n=1 Tax=Streptomyces yaizuensis TaxID=2989713 RepID=UPI002B206815